jgi:hypothetical protein
MYGNLNKNPEIQTKIPETEKKNPEIQTKIYVLFFVWVSIFFIWISGIRQKKKFLFGFP